MWTPTTLLLLLFLAWTPAHAVADVSDLQNTGGPDGIGLPRSQGIPLHVLDSLVEDRVADDDRYDDDDASSPDETTDVVKRAPHKLSRLNVGEGYSRYGRGYLQQLMSSLGSGYNRSNRKSLTRHNLDLGYSRYGRSPNQLNRHQLGKGFSRYGRAPKSLNRFDLGLGYNRYGRTSKPLNRFDLGMGYNRYGRTSKPLNRFDLGTGYNRYGRTSKPLNRFDLGLGYNRYGRAGEAATPSPVQAATSDVSGSTEGTWQPRRWQKQPGYDEPSSAGEDDASTGLMPYDKDDSALPARPISPRHIRDVMTPFRSWLPAHARSFDEATES
ncbi:Hypp3137 [Branchiostoma lanceolatum]|uniref:Hypp3137 protein n=1 Tax=Branchiostoma lanceolatum TaxID=7740 RepID=A0A8K0EWH7_BRALA|nr:Hypp3137 [Branchiostoma lanceolatum]